MTFISHAQNFEDVVLRRGFRDIENGRYIDVGAHDPVVDSVSLAFYEAGWRGMHVEPLPRYAAKLREARADEAVIEAAVTDATGPIRFYELDGLSSGNRLVAERHAAAGHVAREIFVTTIRLDSLLEALGPEIHWLKVDVEGMEADALRSWGECPIRPWALVIESTFPNTQEPQEHLWIEEVTKRGYDEVFFDGLSRYFLHEQHRDRAGAFAPANIFDRFTVTPGHFSAALIRSELYARDEQIAAQSRQVQKLTHEATTRIGILQDDLAVAKEVSANLETQRNELRVELSRFQERSAQLEDKLDRADQSYRDAKERIAQADERSARLQNELDRANEASRQTSARLAGLQDELADLRAVEMRLELERDQERNARKILEGDVDHLASAIAEATVLVKDVTEPIKISRRILQLLGIARERPRWSALQAWAESHAPHKRGTASSMNNTPPISGRNPYLRANSLDELLAWNDLDFIRCAYVTLLGRQPDHQGESYYAERLRRGHSKMDVLWQLRQSTEARSHDPGIAGLDRALRRSRAWPWFPRAMRRLAGSRQSPPSPPAGDPSPPVASGWYSVLPHSNSKRIDELVREREALSAEVQSLKGVVDGLAHAVRGMAKAQARQELEIRQMRSDGGAATRHRTSASVKK